MLVKTVFSNKVGNDSVGVATATETVNDGLKKLNTSTEHFDKRFPNNVAIKQALVLLGNMYDKLQSVASQLKTTGIRHHN